MTSYVSLNKANVFKIAVADYYNNIMIEVTITLSRPIVVNYAGRWSVTPGGVAYRWVHGSILEIDTRLKGVLDSGVEFTIEYSHDCPI